MLNFTKYITSSPAILPSSIGGTVEVNITDSKLVQLVEGKIIVFIVLELKQFSRMFVIPSGITTLSSVPLYDNKELPILT